MGLHFYLSANNVILNSTATHPLIKPKLIVMLRGFGWWREPTQGQAQRLEQLGEHNNTGEVRIVLEWQG